MTLDGDPYAAHRFRVTCEALPKLGFTEVRGLSVGVAVRTEERASDDSPVDPPEWWHWSDWFERLDRERDPPVERRQTHSPNLELRRGITDDTSLWSWLEGWVAGDVGPQDVYVCLLDSTGTPVRGWACREATPVRWTGPDLVADRATVATESLELVHEGVDAVTDLSECE